ncbi:MAG: NAD(P)/FAD-dependent oxidoreductase [Deltaproteobacteria bacterium]|nr:NAD(P)/FAD-dependent oxidoreductase [Deltaproteobacteria bacterium]
MAPVGILPPQPTRPYDVIVVGAGVAGLAASKRLRAEGKRVLVLEASARVGGRALSDNKRFSVPIDLGAGWLHDPKNNPFLPFVEKGGTAPANSMFTQLLFVNGKPATAEERKAFDRVHDGLEKALQREARAGHDVSAGALLDKKERFASSAGAVFGAFESAREIDETSVMDVGIFGAGDDLFVKKGIGNLIEAWGKEARVKLRTPVDSIHYDEGGVVVRTKTGEVYQATTAIVTTSTGVLASGAIRFTPKLPSETSAAIKALPMGLMNKVIFEFDDRANAVFAKIPDNTGAIFHDDDGAPVAFVLRPHGKNMAIGFVGGENAWRLEKLPVKDLKALMLGKLTSAYGPTLAASVKASTVTQWGKNPFTRGAYSAADPGKADARQTLADPVAGRVFFAGEAVAGPEDNGTLRGAYRSGEAASKRVMAQLAKDARKVRLPHHPALIAA